MLKPLLRTIVNLSGNVKLACYIKEYNKTDNLEFETYIRNASFEPLSSQLAHNDRNINLLGSSYEVDMKEFFDDYKDNFFKSHFNYDKSDLKKLDIYNNIKPRNTDFEFGTKRVSYSKSGFTHAFYAPIYIENVNDLPDYFMINIEYKSGKYQTTRSLKVNIGQNSSDKKNYLYRYLKNYTEINFDNNVIYCLPNTKQVLYYGLDLNYGAKIKVIDNILIESFNSQITIQDLDYKICEGFKRNNLIIKQVIPLAFYFNPNELLSKDEQIKFSGAKMKIYGQYVKNDNIVDFYDWDSDYDILNLKHKEFNNCFGWLEDVYKRDENNEIVNIMNVDYPSLNDSLINEYQFSNRTTKFYCRWMLKYSSEDNPYVTNTSWAFSYNQNEQFNYGEFPIKTNTIEGYCEIYDHLYNLILPIAHREIPKNYLYKYNNVFNKFNCDWFNLLNGDFLNNEWGEIDDLTNKTYFKGILYNIGNVYNKVETNKHIDKFNVFIKPIVNNITKTLWFAKNTFINHQNPIIRNYDKNCRINANSINNNCHIYSISNKSKDAIVNDCIYVKHEGEGYGDYCDINDFLINEGDYATNHFDFYEANNYYDLIEIKNVFGDLINVEDLDLYGSIVDAYILLPIEKLSSVYKNNEFIFSDDVLFSQYRNNLYYGYKASDAKTKLWSSYYNKYRLNNLTDNYEDTDFCFYIKTSMISADNLKDYLIDRSLTIEKQIKVKSSAEQKFEKIEFDPALSTFTFYISNCTLEADPNNTYHIKGEKELLSKVIFNLSNGSIEADENNQYYFKGNEIIKEENNNEEEIIENVVSIDKDKLHRYFYSPTVKYDNNTYKNEHFEELIDSKIFYGKTIPDTINGHKDNNVLYLDSFDLVPIMMNNGGYDILNRYIKENTMDLSDTYEYFAKFLNYDHLRLYVTIIAKSLFETKEEILNSLYVKERVAVTDNYQLHIKDKYTKLKELLPELNTEDGLTSLMIMISDKVKYNKLSNIFEINGEKYEIAYKGKFIKLTQEFDEIVSHIFNEGIYKDLYIYSLEYTDSSNYYKIIDTNSNNSELYEIGNCLTPIFNNIYLQNKKDAIIITEYNLSNIVKCELQGTKDNHYKWYRHNAYDILCMYDISSVKDSIRIKKMLENGMETFDMVESEKPYFSKFDWNDIIEYAITTEKVELTDIKYGYVIYNEVNLGDDTCSKELISESSLIYNSIDEAYKFALKYIKKSNKYTNQAIYIKNSLGMEGRYEFEWGVSNKSVNNIIPFDIKYKYNIKDYVKEMIDNGYYIYNDSDDYLKQKYLYRNFILENKHNEDYSQYEKYNYSIFRYNNCNFETYINENHLESKVYVTKYKYKIFDYTSKLFDTYDDAIYSIKNYINNNFEKPDEEIYKETNLNVISLNGKNYGFFVVNVNIDNTLISLNLGTKNNSLVKSISYINNIPMSNSKKIGSLIYWIYPYLKNNPFRIIQNSDLCISPYNLLINMKYLTSKNYFNSGGEYVNVYYNENFHKKHYKLSLYRYFDSIKPILNKTTTIDSYDLKFKKVNKKIIKVGDNNNCDSVIYKTNHNISKYDGIRVYNSIDDINDYEIYYENLEYKYLNDSNFINLPTSFEITVYNNIKGDELNKYTKELESDDKKVKLLKKYLNKNHSNSFNDDEILFLLNKYNVTIERISNGLDILLLNVTYRILYKFNLY